MVGLFQSLSDPEILHNTDNWESTGTPFFHTKNLPFTVFFLPRTPPLTGKRIHTSIPPTSASPRGRTSPVWETENQAGPWGPGHHPFSVGTVSSLMHQDSSRNDKVTKGRSRGVLIQQPAPQSRRVATTSHRHPPRPRCWGASMPASAPGPEHPHTGSGPISLFFRCQEESSDLPQPLNSGSHLICR